MLILRKVVLINNIVEIDFVNAQTFIVICHEYIAIGKLFNNEIEI